MMNDASRTHGQHYTARLAFALTLCVSLLLDSCALPGTTRAGAVQPTPGVPSAPLASLTVYSVEGGFLHARALNDGLLRWRYPKQTGSLPRGRGPFLLAPAVEGGSVYSAEATGVVFALQASDGAERWRIPLDSPARRLAQRNISEYAGGYDQTPIQVDAGLVYLTTMALQDDQHNDLFALNGHDGAIRWRYPMWFGSPPLLNSSTAYVGATEDNRTVGDVTALDATTGTQLWRVRLDDCPRPRPLAHADDLLYVGTCGGNSLVALRASTGAVVWRTAMRADGGHPADAPFDGASVAGGLVVVSDLDGLSALDARTGERRWSQSLEGSGGPLATADSVFIGTTGRCYTAFDTATGALKWRVSTFSGLPCTDQPYPPSFQRSVYTTSVLAGGILCVDAAVTPSRPIPHGFKQLSMPQVVAMSPRDGSMLWHAGNDVAYDIGELTGPPTLAS